VPTIKDDLRAFILQEFLPGVDPSELTDDTPLLSTNILDSLATLRLVTFLERTFNVQIQSHEIDAEHMETLEAIAALVQSKL
jgi:acyl carrier protein